MSLRAYSTNNTGGDSYAENQNYFATARRINTLQQANSDAQVVILCNENVYDPFGRFNLVNGTYQAIEEMDVLVCFTVTFEALEAGTGFAQVRYAVNGSLNLYPYVGSGVSADEEGISGSFIIHCQAGDLIQLVLIQKSVATANFAAGVYYVKV